MGIRDRYSNVTITSPFSPPYMEKNKEDGGKLVSCQYPHGYPFAISLLLIPNLPGAVSDIYEHYFLVQGHIDSINWCSSLVSSKKFIK